MYIAHPLTRCALLPDCQYAWHVLGGCAAGSQAASRPVFSDAALRFARSSFISGTISSTSADPPKEVVQCGIRPCSIIVFDLPLGRYLLQQAHNPIDWSLGEALNSTEVQWMNVMRR